jgi:hypothetical protein
MRPETEPTCRLDSCDGPPAKRSAYCSTFTGWRGAGWLKETAGGANAARRQALTHLKQPVGPVVSGCQP